MRIRFLAAVLACVSTPALASPWADLGDKQFREDIERLKAARVIEGPINVWPLPWAVMASITSAAVDPRLPPHLRASAERVAKLVDQGEQKRLTEVRIAATSEPALIRDFGGTSREEADASARVQQQLGPLFVSLGVGYRSDQRGKDFHLEPSYVALKAGNWALYGGFVETWWGPGNSSALLFSNSSRPFPKIGFKRLEAKPIDFPVLRWLGPWRLEGFVGELNEKRADFDNPKVIGLRFGFEPVRGLEVGLNRALQLCGKGRPCGPNTIGSALIGFGNADNTGTSDEPGNQIAGFDLSYTTRVGPVTARFYGEVEAEDEDNIIIDKFSRMAGTKLSGPIGDDGASWELGTEYSDTLAWELTTGDRNPGVAYNNFIYTSGFTYKGRPIAASIDGDSKLLSIDGAFTDTENRRWYGSWRHANINRTAIGTRNRISATPEKIDILTGGVIWPTGFGDIRIEARYMNDAPDTLGRSPERVQGELSWQTRF